MNVLSLYVLMTQSSMYPDSSLCLYSLLYLYKGKSIYEVVIIVINNENMRTWIKGSGLDILLTWVSMQQTKQGKILNWIN